MARMFQSSFSEVLNSIDRAITTLKYQVKCAGGTYTHQQKGNLQKLEKHRQKVLEEQHQSRSLPPAPSSSHNSPLHHPSPPPARHSQPPPPISPATADAPTHTAPTQHTANGTHKGSVKRHAPPIPPEGEELGAELVELVRRRTALSHALSHTAAATVIGYLRERLPAIATQLDPILKGLGAGKGKHVSVDLSGSHDALRLTEILQQLTEAKDDEQQRSWHLHEDEDTIATLLHDMFSILDNADPAVCKQVLRQDDYASVHNLVLYYQMESRIALRVGLVQVFGALCELERELISVLLCSVLPIELARDILDTITHGAAHKGDTDIEKLHCSLILFAMLFSTGEKPPQQCYDQLDATFLSVLLDGVENPLEDRDNLSDCALHALLAFNLHFDLPEDNPLMALLASKGCTEKTLTEKLMLLLNRDVDPVCRFDHEPKAPNSVQKFFTDIYSQESTSTLLYTNDEKVLVDIMLQRIEDSSPGDQVRTEFLSLLHVFLRYSGYAEYQVYRRELNAALARIAREDAQGEGAAPGTGDMDARIVQQIWHDFPDLFSPN